MMISFILEQHQMKQVYFSIIV